MAFCNANRPPMSKLFACAFLVLAMTPVQAQRVGPMKGAGAATCGEYLQDRQGGPAQAVQYAAYVQGYMSGYNQFGALSVIKEIPRSETIWAYLDKYCRDSPLDHVQDGLAYLMRDLGGFMPVAR
jgi:hypothetical protein